MVKFSDELRGINEQAALSFDRRKNPAEYDLKEKEEMLEAVTEAFNAANCGSSPACPCTGTSTAGPDSGPAAAGPAHRVRDRRDVPAGALRPGEH